MFKKMKQWWSGRKKKSPYETPSIQEETYTRDQLGKAYALGYNDGRRDGLAIARHQATRSLREILKSQNQEQ